MWSFVVALPAVQADFGVARGEASLPFTLTMIGFGVGGIVMGRLADTLRRRACRCWSARSRWASAMCCRRSPPTSGSSRWRRACIGFGASGSFGPMMADISHWFEQPPRHRGRDRVVRQLSRRRDLAAADPVLHLDLRLAHDADRHRRVLRRRHAAADRWRCAAARRRMPACGARRGAAPASSASLGISLERADGAAGASRASPAASPCRCRRSTSSPIAAISATAPARGAEMLSLMLGFGIISRVACGLHRRPDRRRGDAAARLGAAGRRAVPLSAVRRPGLALRDLGAVRPVPGRHRADVRHHRARVFLAAARPARGSASC